MNNTVYLCSTCLQIATHSNEQLLRVSNGPDGSRVSSKLCESCVVNAINALGLVQTTAAAQTSQ
jgi:hypothetical protein